MKLLDSCVVDRSKEFEYLCHNFMFIWTTSKECFLNQTTCQKRSQVVSQLATMSASEEGARLMILNIINNIINIITSNNIINICIIIASSSSS